MSHYFFLSLQTTNIAQAFSEFDQLSSQRNASLLGNSGSSGNGSGSGGKPNGARPSLPMSGTTSVLLILSTGLGMLLL